LTGKRALSLAEAGIDEIDISVNGFDKESHNRVTQGVDFNVLKKNLREVGDLLQSGRLGDIRIKIVGLSLPGNKEGAQAFQEETGLEVYLKPVTNRAGLIDAASMGGLQKQCGEMTVCQRPFVKAYVLYNGDMVLCNCDWMRTTIIGNVSSSTLEELWLGPAMMEIRRAHLKGEFSKKLPCAECDYPYLI
ncbi:MAG: SPASM domain-containing protein, partial [Planctomycetes bacterium]|nr:SPASM domain-containing protein [Planctomycetota bacterium]